MSTVTVSATKLTGAVGADLGPRAAKPTAVEGDPQDATLQAFASDDGRAASGVWECSPGVFRSDKVGFHEIVQILAGRATMVSDAGETTELAAGDHAVFPDGWRGVWTVHETFRKAYVLVYTNA